MAQAPDPFDLSTEVPPVIAAGLNGEIQPKPKASVGLSKKVIFAIFGAVVAGVLIFVAAIDNYDSKKAAPAVDEEKRDPDAAKLAVRGGLPNDLKSEKKGAVAAPAVVPAPDEKEASPMPGGVPALGDGRPGNSSVLQGANAKGGLPAGAMQQPGNLSPEQQRAMVAKQEREDRLKQARLSGLEAKVYQEASAAAPGAGVPGANNLASAGNTSTGLFGPGEAGSAQSPAGDQEQKLKFLKDGGNAPAGYHPATVLPPASPFQLNAGSKIPSMLEMGVNSDLPGMVTARVRENVYASVKDSCLVIPSASLLIGRYDSRVAIGQARQLVVWNQAIFPNGYELNLAGMSSADAGGQAGLEADVDNHWLRLFGVALGMTAVTAGVQMSVSSPPTTSTNGVTSQPTNAQTISNALTQQFGQLGGQMMGKYLNVQPTLKNYFGERFNIIVPRSIVFPGCYKG